MFRSQKNWCGLLVQDVSKILLLIVVLLSPLNKMYDLVAPVMGLGIQKINK